tara:strand:+ start:372 stop:770 length:399 start_codon:yes stop_codon:yes gene_type:complete
MSPFLIILVILACSGRVDGSSEVVFGLEKVKLDRIYDPDARPEHLLLVSGSLKLTGGLRGNVWETVTYIPQRTAAPRTDRGHFRKVGNRLLFYSHLTCGTYQGLVIEKGERLLINRVARDGRSQSEVWYIVR